jgi:HEAT repeat-containing protein 5
LAFKEVAAMLPPLQKEDVRAVAIMLYSGKQQLEDSINSQKFSHYLFLDLLRDESSDCDIIGSTLPALKSIFQLSPGNDDMSAQERFCQSVHGLLSTCLINLDAMRYVTTLLDRIYNIYICRGRQGTACFKIIKNNMLTAVLVLTILPAQIKVGYRVIEQCCAMIAKCLSGSDEVCL